MKILIWAFVLLICEAGLTIASLYYAGHDFPNILESPLGYLAYPVLVTFLGLILGFIIFEVAWISFGKRNKSIYVWVLQAGFLAYIIFTAIDMMDSRRHQKTYGYNSSIQDMMERADSEGGHYIVTGFGLLQSSLSLKANLRDLHIRFVQYENRDTVLANISDTFHLMYFVYTYDLNDKVDRISTISVFRDKPALISFDLRADASADYARIKLARDKKRKESIDEVIDIIKKDSTLKKMIIESQTTDSQ